MTELEDFLTKEAKKIARRIGVNLPFFIEVTNGMDDDYVCAIHKGNPPIIYINRKALASFDYIKPKLERAIDKVEIMTWDLSNVPPAESIALKANSTKWTKGTSLDDFVRIVSDKLFKVTFQVEVEVFDKLTGISLKLQGNDPYALEKEAKRRLSQMLLEGEKAAELEEFLEKTSPKVIATNIEPKKADMIIIKDEPRGVREDHIYE